MKELARVLRNGAPKGQGHATPADQRPRTGPVSLRTPQHMVCPCVANSSSRESKWPKSSSTFADRSHTEQPPGALEAPSQSTAVRATASKRVSPSAFPGSVKARGRGVAVPVGLRHFPAHESHPRRQGRPEFLDQPHQALRGAREGGQFRDGPIGRIAILVQHPAHESSRSCQFHAVPLGPVDRAAWNSRQAPTTQCETPGSRLAQEENDAWATAGSYRPRKEWFLGRSLPRVHPQPQML